VLEDAVSGDPRESVTRVRRSDGTYVTVEGIASPILDANGKPRMLVSSSRDISERLRAAELEERLHQSRRLESVGRLAGGIGHDFNNLLTAMNGYGEIALTRLAAPGADEKLRECFDEIRRAGDKATTLVSQLLALSRRQVIQPTVLDLNHVVQDYEPMLGRLLGDDVRVRVALADDIGAVLADEGQLGQVIVNLAVNARDAMPGGGTLSMSTRDVALEDTVGPLPPGEYVMLAVEDTGLGIAPELLDQVFDPFFTTKGPGEGSGLGLATVLGVVEQSGGYVSVYSEPGSPTGCAPTAWPTRPLHVRLHRRRDDLARRARPGNGLPAEAVQRRTAAAQASRSPRGAGRKLALSPGIRRRSLREAVQPAGTAVADRAAPRSGLGGLGKPS